MTRQKIVSNCISYYYDDDDDGNKIFLDCFCSVCKQAMLEFILILHMHKINNDYFGF